MSVRSASFAVCFLLFVLSSLGVGGHNSSKQPAAQSPQPAPAQTAPSNTQTPTLKINTRLVVVDVVASDSKGAPVTDLKAGDFTVQEEGVEQPVQVFSFHQSGSTESDPAPTSAFVPQDKLPKGIFTNVPPQQPGGALNVVLLDALNTTLQNQAAMHEAMVKLLAKLPAG